MGTMLKILIIGIGLTMTALATTTIEQTVQAPDFSSSPKLGIVSMMGGESAALGLGLVYRLFPRWDMEADFGSAIILHALSATTRFYFSTEKWSPYVAAGYSRWKFNKFTKAGRFLMHHYGLLASEQMLAQAPSVNLGHAFFGIRSRINDKMSWYYEGGFFISAKEEFVAVPTLGMGIHWYVF